MSKLPTRPPEELVEIERLIHELMSDAHHPINNRRHPLHDDCVIALNELMERADTLRNSWLIG